MKVNSLRNRLLASYTLVILICLTVVGAAMWLILLRRSLPDRQLYQELQTKSQVVLLRQVRDELIRGQPSERGLLAMQRLAGTLMARVLVLEKDGRVIIDSDEALVGINLLQESNLSQQAANMVRGSFRPAGTLQRWLFVGRPIDQFRATSERWFVVSQPVPRLPIFQLLGDNLATPLFQAALLGLVLSVLLAWLISRSVARPVQQAAAAARAVAAGDYDQQLPPSGPVEIQELARSFNQMAQQVKTSRQAQSDLIANVSHDLKTPLTSIQGFSQAILDGMASDSQETQRVAQIIHDEAGRMRRMVNDLLLLARMDAGQLELNWQPLDLAKLLKSCLTRFEPRAQEAGIALDLNIPPHRFTATHR